MEQKKKLLMIGKRVQKNGIIISYISSEEEILLKKISELDDKVQKAMENKVNIYSPDIKNLEAEIQMKLYKSVEYKSDVYGINEYKNSINELIGKKAKIVGELSPAGSQIKELINQRTDYEIELNEAKMEVKSEKAGLVSYRTDGYENILTPNSFSALSIAELEKIKISADQVIPISNSDIKIVDNFFCYIAVPIAVEEMRDLTLDSTVKIRVNTDVDQKYQKATVVYISKEENDKKLIIFKIDTNVEELTKYRKINLDIIWWNYSGFKLPASVIKYSTIKDETEKEIATLATVIKIEATYREDVWVKVIKEADNFAIIENYTDEELEKMGISEELIKNRAEIQMYDEIIVK